MITSQLYDLFIKCNGVSTDTRTIKKGNLFFSLKGENFDGNKYALEAIKKGAKYAVVDSEKIENPNFIKVDDVLNSLQKLSTFHRLKLSKTKIIAITGSNGKTTTKELIKNILNEKYKTTATKGNLNNHIGVPLTLLQIDKNSDFAIVEMGANHIGEIEFLTNLIKPDIGYITNFGKAHLDGFGGIKGVIQGKSELYNWLLKNNKPILINSDDTIQSNFINSNSITFGIKGKAKFIFKEENNGDFLTVKYNKNKIDSNLIGSYNFNNIQAAITLGLYFKIEIKSIKNAIKNFTPKNNRSQYIIRNNKKIILDAYNANPSSMYAAIKFFENFSEKNKILILGDMFELGKDSKKYHQEIAEYCRLIKDTKIFLVGELFCNTTRFKEFNYSENIDNLISKGDLSKIKKSCLFIKGSPPKILISLM